jgi:hypothetical protein
LNIHVPFYQTNLGRNAKQKKNDAKILIGFGGLYGVEGYDIKKSHSDN